MFSITSRNSSYCLEVNWMLVSMSFILDVSLFVYSSNKDLSSTSSFVTVPGVPLLFSAWFSFGSLEDLSSEVFVVCVSVFLFLQSTHLQVSFAFIFLNIVSMIPTQVGWKFSLHIAHDSRSSSKRFSLHFEHIMLFKCKPKFPKCSEKRE
uniref:Uncharacterized protein n=1 Tax=Cacopsylla melanoneura TaxID=428564 RepID=A0A8D8S7B8_9HEMI